MNVIMSMRLGRAALYSQLRRLQHCPGAARGISTKVINQNSFQTSSNTDLNWLTSQIGQSAINYNQEQGEVRLLDESTLSALEEVHGPLSKQPMVPPPRPVVVIISGPSGVGKDSVLNRVKEKRGDLYFVVTATSRSMRPNEVEGRDYFFVSKEKFENWIAQGELLEHALVYGEYKGIPRQQVDQALAAGTDVVLRIDVQGAATVKQLIPEAISIFVAAESEAKLVERLVSRKTETLDKMIVRVQTARHEMEEMKKFDYVVINQDGCLEKCADLIGSIIDAEKAKVSRPSAQQPQQ